MRRQSVPLLSLRASICFVALAAFTAISALAQVHDYTSIVIFGDSLSDTGNVAHITEQLYGVRVPGPPLSDYTDGRFTDGADTAPPALNYFGTWVEQFAASLPSHPEIVDSLDGGTNYAYGFATTANGTSPLTLGSGAEQVQVQVENIGQQITDYLATHPTIDNHTLFIVWGGAIDLLNASASQDVFNAALRQTLNIQRLVQAGATQFLVPNLPPLGLTPRLNGSPSAALTATTASLIFNADLAIGLSVLRDFYPRRHLVFYQLDTFKLLRSVVSAPGAYSLNDVKHSAQGLQVNPDTYLFWDDLHPTTRGHNILAGAATSLVAP